MAENKTICASRAFIPFSGASAAWEVLPKNSNLLVARAREFGVREL